MPAVGVLLHEDGGSKKCNSRNPIKVALRFAQKRSIEGKWLFFTALLGGR
ncbi:hypothetical protein BRO54_0244 [Geobacillus proteiniphilus]|uniref:Uncharacterized protein n=1 Tax=Geobacillus proteiniphilus TaxID=860353 RepID=A0A1Q5T8X8_9BACL|nr:hypothetical protein BRO54_0244 [Geobacillus proteiniphilus]